MARTPEKTRVQDLIVTSGDTVRGEDAAAGTPLPLRGGNSSGGGNPGGALTITGGTGDTTGAGGAVTIATGTPGASGAGGALNISTSAGLGGVGGGMLILAGNGGGGSFNGGGISMFTGNGSASGIGGNLELGSGIGGVTGAGGFVQINAGRGGTTSGDGGAIEITSGSAFFSGDGVGGELRLNSGTGRGTNNDGGDMLFQTGGGTGTAASGDFTFTAADGAEVATLGGGFSVTAGSNPVVAATGGGGSISFTSGSVTDGGSSGNAGDITLTPGTAAGSGADGDLIFSYATWPPADGAPSEVLTTDGAGTLSWAATSSSVIPIEAGVPTDNLVAYVDVGDQNSYPGTGTTVTDLIGNLTAGTISGSTTFTNGSLDFEGTTGALTFTKNASVDNIFDGGGTIMIFFRARSDGESSQGALVNTGYDGSGYNLFTENELSADGGSIRISFQREFTGNDGIWDFLGVNDISVRVARLDSWNSVAIVYDDSALANNPRMYLNGQILPDAQIQVTQTPTVLPAVSDAGNPLIIGNRGADDRTYDGNFDVFLAWDAALDVETIAAAHTVFAQRHGQHTTTGGTGVFGNDRKGSDMFLYAGDYVGTGAAPGGAIFIKGGTTWSDNNSSEGGRVEIRGGDSQQELDGTGGGGALGVIIAVGGFGDQDSNTRTVGNLANITGEFGGGTVTSGNGANRTLFRGTDNNATGNGGALILRGGDCIDGSGSDGGGAVGIRSGQPRGGGSPTPMYLRGSGPYDGTGGTTGAIYLTTRVAAITGDPLGAQGNADTNTGSIFIDTLGSSSTQTTGNITIETGVCNDTTGNNTGDITIEGGRLSQTGQSFSGGGSVTIIGGASNGNSSSPGGSITLTAGAQDGTGTGNLSEGGSVTLTAGDSNKNNATSGGGNLTFDAGDASSVTGPGGAVTITAGDQTGTTSSAVAGTITLTAGDTTDGGSTGAAGSIVLNPGTASGSGADGVVQVNGKLTVTGMIDPPGMTMSESASNPGVVAAGDGTIWVRNDSPNVLVFTDDTGADTVLGASGASTLQEAYVGGNTIVTDTTNGDFDVSGTEAISLDASAASNFTVAGAALTLSTTTSGTVAITSAGVVDIDSGASGDIEVTAGAGTSAGGGSVELTAGAGAATFAGGAFTVATGMGGSGAPGGAATVTMGAGGTDGGDAGSWSFLGAPGAAGTTGAGGGGSDIAWSSGAGGDGASGFAGGAGGDWGLLLGPGGAGTGAGAGGVGGGAAFTLGAGGAAGTTLDGGIGGSFTFTAGAGGATTAGTGGDGGSIGFSTGAGGAPGGGTGGDSGSFGIVIGTPGAGGATGTFDVIGGDSTFSGSASVAGGVSTPGVSSGSTLDIDAVGALAINSSGSTLGFGNDADTGAISIGTGAAARAITIGNTTGATSVDIDAGTGDINLNTDTVVTGKLTVTGLIDPTGLVLTEQSSTPSTPTATEGTIWVRDDTDQTLMFTDDQGDDYEVAAGGLRRMQEIPLTVANLARDSTGAPAAGIPGGGVPVTQGENVNSRIQYLQFGKSTEDDFGAAWDIVLPDAYSGNGLTVEFYLTGDGSASAAADFRGQFERQTAGFDINASSYATAQAATGDTINATANITVLATITFTNAQIDGLLAGEAARFAITRIQSDSYAGVVLMTKGRIYETV